MKVGFVETMRGALRDGGGSESKVEFEVHAEAEHLRAFLRDGHTRLLLEEGEHFTRADFTGRPVAGNGADGQGPDAFGGGSDPRDARRSQPVYLRWLGNAWIAGRQSAADDHGDESAGR